MYIQQTKTINDEEKYDLMKISFEQPNFDLEMLGGVLKNTELFKGVMKPVLNEVTLRFSRMNIQVRQSILNSLSPEAKKCLESLLGVEEQISR